jgi:hypothetical protein
MFFCNTKFLIFLGLIFSLHIDSFAQCVQSSGTYNQRILASADDAEETKSTGAINLNGTAYELLNNGSSQTNGLRFTTVNIPVGATITSAYIEFTANAAASSAATFDIYGQSLGNPTTFTTAVRNISSRFRTNNFVAWTLTAWVINTAYQSPDITTIVQEIVNQSNWVSGNAMAFLLDNPSSTNVRIAKSFDNATAQAPRLVINWQINSPITTTINVSSCFDSNGNVAGGTNQTTIQVIVDWQNRPGTQDIILKLQGQANVTIDPDLVSKPYIYQYTLPADGTTKTVDANWSTTTTCIATQKIAQLPLGNCILTPCAAGNTGGKVWRDLDNDGIKDAGETVGIAGVFVNVYDCNGSLLATTKTDYLGQYTFPNLIYPNKYRIEYSNYPSPFQPTANGVDGRTEVQFIAAAECAVDFGVNNPADYCQSNPFLVTNCYANGNNSTGTSGTSDVLVKFNYNNTLATPTPTHVAFANQVGTTWGLAYQKESKKLFSAAFIKRHTGLGPLGTGGIYATDMTSGITSNFVNLNGLGGIATGADPHSGLLGDYTLSSKDSLAFHEVGKRAFGDMDISDDGKNLFVVNLFTKQIHKIFINNPAVVPTAANITSYNIPNPCGNSDYRPFALKYWKGKIYVGVVCTGETSQNRADLSASVYEMNPTTGVFSALPVLSFPLTYTHGRVWKPTTASNLWYPWLNNWNNVLMDAGNSVITYPQPELTDIEFDLDGSMILGLRDRGGDQFGWFNDYPNGSNENAEMVAGGDILRAATLSNGTGWVIENNGIAGALNSGVANGQGLGGSEFYKGDVFTGGNLTYGHEETSDGGLAILLGSGEIAMTAVDPPADSYGFGGYNSAGVRFISNTNGAFADGYIVYDTDINAGTFQKSGGLGDLELLCNVQPLQIGNFVWLDTDKDGVQDPCETPIAGIKVRLYKGTTLIAESTTNSNGEYYFQSAFYAGAGNTWSGTGADTALLANTAYNIVFGKSTADQYNATSGAIVVGVTNYFLTKPNTGTGNDLSDSDASMATLAGIGTYPSIALTTPVNGSNHTFDVGFSNCPNLTTIANVSGCFDSNGNTAGGTSQTILQVIVDWSIRPAAQNIVLKIQGQADIIIDPSTSPKPYIYTNTYNSDGSIKTIDANWSLSTTCVATQKTVVFPTGPCLLTPCLAGNTGGTVWRDLDNDGIKDANEATSGISGTTVNAYDCNGNLVATDTTDYLGQYSFSGLTFPNKYRFEFSNLPTPYLPTANGADGRTDVQFISTAECAVDFGANNPADYCGSKPLLATSCYVPGNQMTGINANFDVLISVPSTAGSLTPPANTPAPTHLAFAKQIGSTFGLAYHKLSKTLLTASYYKYLTGFGPAGQDAIYAINAGTDAMMGTADDVVSTFMEFDNYFGTNSTGTDIFAAPYTLRGDSTKTTRASFGDIEMSNDGSKLYVMNLGDRKLYTIPVTGNPLQPFGVIQISPVVPNIAACTGVMRPFSIEPMPDGNVLVGAVCDANSSHLYVWKYNPTTNTWSTSPAFDGFFNNGSAYTCCWGSYDNINYESGAILAGLELDDKGDLTLAIRLRESDSEISRNTGNIFKACANGAGGWVLESNGICGGMNGAGVGDNLGPDGGSFYLDGAADGPNLSIMGGMTYLSGSNLMISTFDDAFAVYTANILWSNVNNGTKAKAYNIGTFVPLDESTLSGKQSILGELEALCIENQPLQIGNYVWLDTDLDGVQDPFETPIAGIKARLYKGTSLIAEVTTNSLGEYYFQSASVVGASNTWLGTGADTALLANTAYNIVFGKSTTDQYSAASGGIGVAGVDYFLTKQNSSTGNDQNDSDAALTNTAGIGNYPTIAAITPSAGSNHTFDVGLFSCPVIGITVNVSGAYDSNGNAPSGTSVADVQVILDWQYRPGTQDIVLKIQGQADVTIDPDLVSNPYVYTLTIPADGTTKSVVANWSISSACSSASVSAKLPTARPLLRKCQTGNTGGVVWRDLDNDGIQDAIETQDAGAGIIVTAYDCNGNAVETTTTDDLGQYSFLTLTYPNKYRIEFSDLPAGYFPTFNGTNGHTDVQFTSTVGCNVNLGVNRPADYCQAAPRLYLPCYENAQPAGNLNPGIISMNWNAMDVPAMNGGTGPNPVLDATISEVGSVWGNAWQKNKKRAFFSSFLKRHVGFADGPGYVYAFDYAATGVPLLKKFNLQGVTPNNGGAAIDLGSICRSSACASNAGNTGVAADYEMPTTTNVKFVDIDAFAKVGKMSFGDAEMDETDNTLWLVNTFQNALISVDVSANAAASLPGTVKQYPIAGITGLPTCTGGVLRPWALKFSNGKGYLGLVCDASVSKQAVDLQAFIVSFNPSNPTAGFTTEYNFPLNYNRETGHQLSNTSATWQFWANTWAEAAPFSRADDNNFMAPQPILSDIEITANGSLILGFMDRFGNQNSRGNYRPISGNTSSDDTNTLGDLIKVCKTTNGGFALEGSAGCPDSDNNSITGDPNNTQRQDDGALNQGEFFYEDYFGSAVGNFLHNETATGALALYPASNSVVSTHFDPTTPSSRVNTQGIVWHNTDAGNRTQAYEIVNSTPANTNTTFGKANGLGDLELMCDPQPLQIGNYVWLDADKDGTQDPCEMQLVGVKVALYKDVAGVLTLVANTTTDANGEYYFTGLGAPNENWIATAGTDSLLPNTNYKVVFGTDGTTPQAVGGHLILAGTDYVLTTFDSGEGTSPDQNDSDASLISILGTNYPTIALTTGSAGSTNHTYDVGFVFCPNITNPSLAQSFCFGMSGTNITVKTNYNAANGIRFVKFSSNQSSINGAETPTELTNIYAGTPIATVTPTGASSPYTATYSYQSTDFPTIGTYYVYAILNPDIALDCRPVQEIIVTVKPQPNILDVTKTCPMGGGPVTTHDFAFTGTWSITSQPSGASAAINGVGVASNMIIMGNYVYSVTVNGCTDTATITVPACCPVPSCVPVKILKL